MELRHLCHSVVLVLMLAGPLAAPSRGQSAAPVENDTVDEGRALVVAFARIKQLVIWQHQWHMQDTLTRDPVLSEACQQRRFNQRYLMLHKAVFANRYWVGVAWKNPNVLVDRDGMAQGNQIYYFHRDGGRDGYDRCEVYVQTLNKELADE